MTKARDLANLIAAGNPLADGAISVAEISDLTASAADLNNVAGINSSVQTQLDAKAPLASPTLTGTVTMGGTTYPTSDGTEGQVLTTNGSGAVSFADPAGGGSADFVASGAIANGDVVVLNSDGTVSVVDPSGGGADINSVVNTAVFESADVDDISAAFDSTNQKLVIAYTDKGNSNYGTAVVGTISGSSITFGTPVVFSSSSTLYSSVTYDSNASKIVVAFTNIGNSYTGTVVVGTVSGTSISFGTAVTLQTSMENLSTSYDSSAQKVIVAYRKSSSGRSVVGTVSGTSISFGSEAIFESGDTDEISVAYDSNSNKTVIAYRDRSGSFYGTAVVGTVSGTSISYGTPVVFSNAGSIQYTSIVFDSNANKVVIAYRDNGNSARGTAIVGTVSGTSISFGTAVVFNSATTTFTVASYDASAKSVVISYSDTTNSERGTAVAGTVSGTSISFTTPVVFETGISYFIFSAYDSINQNVVSFYSDRSNSNYGTATVLEATGLSNAPSYIGVADGATSDTATGKITINGGVANTGALSTYDFANASYDSVSLSVASQDTDPYSTAFNNDGTKMYVLGSVNDSIYQYSLSTAFDLSTASYDSVSFSVTSQDTNPNGMVFNNDGTKMYVVGRSSDSVHQYTLSTAFDLSTASYDSVSFSVVSQDDWPRDVAFNNDGTKMYVLATAAGLGVFQYTLSTAFDLSTASYDNVNFNVLSQDNDMRGLTFNNDGTKMYTVGWVNDSIYQYSLSTAFDLSTASYDSVNFNVSTQDSLPSDVFFNNDGTKMYVTGLSSDSVHQYSTAKFLTIGTTYYVADNGDLQTTNNGRKIGKAISATKLLVNSNMSGDEMNAYLGGLV